MMSLPARGFTMVELVMVLVVLGLLAVVVLPRMDSGQAFREMGFRDQVAAALRHAQKTAVSHRRLVCATVAADQLSLAIASAHPASACGSALAGPDGRLPSASSPSVGIALASAPAGPLYFQPSGTVTNDGAGTTPTDFTLTVTNQAAIAVLGTTGHVE